MCQLRALGLGREATTEAFLGLTSENLGSLRTSLLDAMAPKEARHDQLIGVISKLIVLSWEIQPGFASPDEGWPRYHWSLRLET